MSEPRVKVWVQKFKDRSNLMLQWIDPDTGRRKSQSSETADEAKAEIARADLESDLNHGRYAAASRMTWEAFRELFEEEYFPNCRPETCKVYEHAFGLFEQVCSPKSLRSITERTISALAAGLRKLPGRGHGGPMEAITIKVRLQFLHTALAWAAEQKLIPKCPKFPTIKVPRKKPQPVPAEAFEKLLAKAEGQMKAFLLCGWLAGLRRNEALALEWLESDKAPWVDSLRNRIWLPAEFVKGVEDQWVPLDPQLKDALEALPRHGRKVFRLLSRMTGEPLTPSGVSLEVTKLAKRAGVKLTMKALRKGFGCRYAGSVSTHVLQRLMRHANISTTMAYYANVDDAVEKAVLGRSCNSLRNSQAAPQQEDSIGVDAKPETGKAFD